MDVVPVSGLSLVLLPVPQLSSRDDSGQMVGMRATSDFAETKQFNLCGGQFGFESSPATSMTRFASVSNR